MLSPTVVRFEVATQVGWRAFRDPKTSQWVAICDALNVTAEGDTWSDLERTIDEIQQELFLDLLQEGELDAFLHRHGWVPMTPLPQARGDGVVFDMPAHIIPVSNDQARAARQ